MKKLLFTMVALLGMAVSSQAMSYEQARQQALFLADKMAYELNLTEEQYEACYEVNLDYLMGVTSQHDLYGDYWARRNADLSYILYDWQYQMFLNATYFYRPLYWADGFWHFGIYARYPHRDYLYFGRPHFYVVYRGGHAWHHNGGHSWYHGRDFGHHSPHHKRDVHAGMRDGFNKGNYGRGGNLNGPRQHNGAQPGGRHDRRELNRGQSSTRSTVGNRGNEPRPQGGSHVGNGQPGRNTFGGNRMGAVEQKNSVVERSKATRVERSATPSAPRQTNSVQMRSSQPSSVKSSGSSPSRSSGASSMRSSGGGSRSGGSHSSGGSHMGGGRR